MAVLSMRACWCLGFTVVLGAMVHAPGSAPASPLEDTTMNGAVFTGPAHPHATSVYLNPGALGLATEGWHFYFGGSLRLDRVDIARQRIVDPAVGLEPGPEVSAVPISPGGTIAAVNVGSKVSVGMAFGLPLSEELISNQPALGYHVLDGHHRQWAGVLAVAFQVNRRLQVGTGLWLTNTSLELSFLRDTALERGETDATDCAGTTVCGIENPDAAEQYDLVVGSPDLLATQNLALSIGAIYQFAQDWWLGLSYQSPSGLQSPIALTGTAKVTPSPRDARQGAMPSAGQAAVSYKLPQSLSLGVRGPIAGDYELVASMRWQAWSRQRMLDVRLFGRDLAAEVPEWYPRYRGLRDVFLAEAGIEGREGRRARLGARARIETGATAPEAVSPVQIDGWNLTGVIGSEFRLTDSLALSLSYGITWFPTRDVDDSLFDPRDRVACIDSGYALDECTAAAAGRALPTAAGTYDRLSHALRVSLRFSPL